MDKEPVLERTKEGTISEAAKRLLGENSQEPTPTEEPEIVAEEDTTEVVSETTETVEEVEETEEVVEEEAEVEPEEVEEEVEEEEPYFTVKVAGEELEVNLDELISGYQRQKDYTKKTQDLAEQRKSFETKSEELGALQETFVQQASLADELLNRDLKKYENVDWDSLKTEDPQKYLTKKIEVQEIHEKKAELQTAVRQTLEHNQKQQQAAYEQELQVQRNELLKRIPEWKDAKKREAGEAELIQYGLASGYTEQDLASLYKAASIDTLRKAMLYDKLEATKKSIPEKQKTPKGNFHEWQEDRLAAVEDNPVDEGADATQTALTPTVRQGNYCQINSKSWIISGTDLVADNAGRGVEMAYQEAKKGLELRKDVEYVCVGVNKAADAGTGNAGGSPTPRQAATVLSWIHTNTNYDEVGTGGAPGANPTGDGTDARTDATPSTLRTFDESMLEDVIDQIYIYGGNPDTIMANTVQKRIITKTFKGSADSRDINVPDKRVIACVDFYESDYGVLSVVPNRYMRPRDVFVLDTDMWEVAYHRPFMTYDLAKTGDNEKKQMIVEWTLVSKEDGSGGGVFDLNEG